MHANKPQPGLSEKAPGPGWSEHGLRTVLLLAFGGLLALMLVARVHSALRRYPSDGGPRERQLLEEIEESLSQQESISSAMLSLTPGDRKTRSPKFIQEQLLPRSLSILQVSQQIASLNGQELAKSNQDLLARFASLQSKLKSMLLAALTAGLAHIIREN